MEIKTGYHEEILNSFLQHSPFREDDILNCRPKHLHAIRVTLKNGEQLDYNIQTKSYRFVNRPSINAVDEVTDDILREVFATNLSELMVMKGIGQAVLGERTGLSSACISKYLHKKSTPTITQVERIARALGCHRDDLLE